MASGRTSMRVSLTIRRAPSGLRKRLRSFGEVSDHFRHDCPDTLNLLVKDVQTFLVSARHGTVFPVKNTFIHASDGDENNSGAPFSALEKLFSASTQVGSSDGDSGAQLFDIFGLKADAGVQTVQSYEPALDGEGEIFHPAQAAGSCEKDAWHDEECVYDPANHCITEPGTPPVPPPTLSAGVIRHSPFSLDVEECLRQQLPDCHVLSLDIRIYPARDEIVISSHDVRSILGNKGSRLRGLERFLQLR